MSLFYPRCMAQVSTVFDGRGAPNSKPLLVNASPRECTVSRNGYHEADTWTMDFDGRDTPFDSDSIAQIAVNIFMWDAAGDENRPWAIDSYRMVRGLADEPDQGLIGQQRFSLSGRDYTAALDVEWDPTKKIPAGQPLDQTVRAIADAAAPETATGLFDVEWQAAEPPPITGSSARSTKKKGLWVKPGKTTWDVIYELVISHGFICYIRDASIIITDPRTQTQSSLASAPRLTYGRDLQTLEIKRKLARERVPQIKIVYWDAAERQRFEVIYPENVRYVFNGIGIKKNEVMTLPAPKYCHTRDSALRFAKMRWELMGRGETTYTFSTRYMTVPGADRVSPSDASSDPEFQRLIAGSTFDLLRLEAGDAVGIVFDPFNQEQLRALNEGQRVAFFEDAGYSPAVAAFVAANVTRIDQFRQPYYARKIDYHWSRDNGLTIEVEAVNFVFEQRELAWADGTIPSTSGG